MDTNTREPRTPTSAKKPVDPQRTPKRLIEPLPALFPSPFTSSMSLSRSRPLTRPRRNSWEDEIPPVVALPDPRSENELAFSEIWTGALAQTSKDAQAHFFALLQAEFRDRPAEYARLRAALKAKDAFGRRVSPVSVSASPFSKTKTETDEHDRTDIRHILDVTSVLFAGHGELARAFNHCLGPGYGMEAAEEYVTVYTPRCGWKQYPDGRREYHVEMDAFC